MLPLLCLTVMISLLCFSTLFKCAKIVTDCRACCSPPPFSSLNPFLVGMASFQTANSIYFTPILTKQAVLIIF